MIQLPRRIIDENTRAYASRTKLTNKRIEAASCGEPDKAQENLFGMQISMGMIAAVLDPQAPVVNGFLETVLAIPGVEAAVVIPYEVMIVKARAFSWEEIENKLVVLLGAFNAPLIEIKPKIVNKKKEK